MREAWKAVDRAHRKAKREKRVLKMDNGNEIAIGPGKGEAFTISFSGAPQYTPTSDPEDERKYQEQMERADIAEISGIGGIVDPPRDYTSDIMRDPELAKWHREKQTKLDVPGEVMPDSSTESLRGITRTPGYFDRVPVRSRPGYEMLRAIPCAACNGALEWSMCPDRDAWRGYCSACDACRIVTGEDLHLRAAAPYYQLSWKDSPVDPQLGSVQEIKTLTPDEVKNGPYW